MPGYQRRSLQRRLQGLEWENRRLREENERLKQENERLRRQLEEALRAARRQAAPHSRGEAKADPKRPGRKAGQQYGQHHCRPVPRPVAAQVQLGPEALAAQLNKQMGLSLGHTAEVLKLGFGFQVSRAGIYRALARMAANAAPTYQELLRAARASLANGVDETGWRVGCRLPWMWVAVSAQVTGSAATATGRYCWRLWWTAGDSPAPAIGPPTGFCWVKPKDAVAWTAPIKPTAQLAS